MNPTGISIVLPTFNEATGIASVLVRLTGHIATLASHYEIDVVIVDDGSSDGTADVLRRYSDENPGLINVVRHERNAGLTAAMRTGAGAARHGTIVFLDADLSYRPEVIEPLVRALRSSGAKAALASPYMKGGRVANVPAVRHLASRGANWILTRCAGGRLHTFTGMVRAYDRATFLDLFEREQVGEFNTWAVATLLADGHEVVEIPADLVWPPERYAAASRLKVNDLIQRVYLVVETARVLSSAARSSREGIVGPSHYSASVLDPVPTTNNSLS